MFRLLTLLVLLQLTVSSSISHPDLDFDELGGRIGILGSFDSISYYSQTNDTESLAWTNSDDEDTTSNNKLFIRKDNNTQNFAEVSGEITDVQKLSSDTILINGDFDEINDESCQPPIIYNLTNNEITNLFSSSSKREDLPSLDGEIKVTFIDGDLIYLGGDFEYQDSYGAVIYNQTSKEIIELPFKGFGKNATINAITKVVADDDDEGLIIFGGSFDTLGILDLLLHNLTLLSNSTKHSNWTNTSIVTAEQKITLKHGVFTDVNGDGSDPSSLICPSTSAQWAPLDNSGGQWKVELPDQMKGLTPTKVRLYVPEGDDSINLFRIYSYPNNGIMNLTYVDPETNEIAYCDAWCPLSTLSKLSDAVSDNKDNIEELSDGDVFIGEDDGTYSVYYDSSTLTKTLSYAGNFQEFAFENDVAIEEVGLTVISWHGSKGAVAGFELYSNSISVYGNETLNEPNCGENPDKTNLVEINSGDFQAITSLVSIDGTNYQVSTGGDGKVTMYPNITYSGDYSIIMITPGCTQDDSCDKRSIVNVTVIDSNDDVVASKQVYQNNNDDKFDYLFYGHLDGSTLSEGQNRVEIEFLRSIESDVDDPWMVIDRIRADIVELDDYYDRNSTNSTRTRHKSDSELAELKLNGLFEYSLANFSYFEEDLIYTTGDDISPNNTFVGNSTINVLSSELSSDSVVKQFNKNDKSLMILGDFSSNSTNLTLSNDNLINLKLDKYNTTSNSTIATLSRRLLFSFNGIEDLELDIRDEIEDLVTRDDDITIFGASFNSTITTITSYNDLSVLLGAFTLNNNDNSSVSIKDLSNDNKSVSDASNFVLYDGETFYSFGNDYIDEEFDTFSHITLKSTEYFIFSSSSGRKTWDNTNKEWITSSSQKLNISLAVSISDDEQVVAGSSFNPMDNYIYNLAYIGSNDDIKDENFNEFNSNLTEGSVTKSYYINDSVAVIGGDFSTDDKTPITNVGFIYSNKSLTGLQGDIDWSSNATIQTLYVDSNENYLFIGYNGSVSAGSLDLAGGVIIYDLKKNNLTSFQPAELSGSSDLEINSVVLYNDGNKLLVGGKFENAGSLACENFCIYDMKNTRWESPNGDLSSEIVNDIKFIKTSEVLISGDLTLDDDAKFVVYDIKKDKFKSTSSALNKLSETPEIIAMGDDKYDDDLSGRFIAAGDGFLKGFDGSSWSDIDGIEFSNETQISDVKLLTLKSSDKKNNSKQKFFKNSQILSVSGKFELDDYGLVNVAFYNGKNWVPFIYSIETGDELGSVNSLLVKDQFRYASLEDINRSSGLLSSGKVVGISLACALGSTTLLSLLYIIPYYALFRKNKDEDSKERIGEKEMMDAVNPEELFHEIDLQRHH